MTRRWFRFIGRACFGGNSFSWVKNLNGSIEDSVFCV
jgi:hypothetical protein